MHNTTPRKNFDSIFQYLQKEEITFSKSDFLFEFESHSEFPSLLAVSDTLNFFEIKNAALKVNNSEITDLPECFLTVLKDVNNIPKYHFIERIENEYFSLSENEESKMSLSDLESKWLKVVLLAEKNNLKKEKKRKNLFNPFLIIMIGIFISIFCFKSNIEIFQLFFIFLPAAGTIFSVISFKNLFELKNSFINRFCSAGATTDCETVSTADKWEIFKILDFGILSIVFFHFNC
ncbi:hypothetical protein [Flavobacterium sp. YO12]|uniref:hypothetical protein n=1 Tax=Flavobacterium sp. YO12 TaxID=1920029 RepID=UPI00100C0DB3|nr:hypothetical protein [Flavobacterium sp. YO12]RXM42057.1 hypothetical protein BOW55_20950 [Flavobacterium sp. YO12]